MKLLMGMAWGRTVDSCQHDRACGPKRRVDSCQHKVRIALRKLAGYCPNLVPPSLLALTDLKGTSALMGAGPNGVVSCSKNSARSHSPQIIGW
jgi:hypothetical protein